MYVSWIWQTSLHVGFDTLLFIVVTIQWEPHRRKLHVQEVANKTLFQNPKYYNLQQTMTWSREETSSNRLKLEWKQRFLSSAN
jgi:hypothetical protein